MNRRILLSLIVAMFFFGKTQAGTGSFTSKIQGAAVVNGAVLDTYDDQYFDMTGLAGTAWHSNNINREIGNYIHLKYTGAATKAYADWYVEVAFSVARWNEYGTSLAAETGTLRVEYNTAAASTYTDISTYKVIAPGNRMRVTITGITYSPGMTVSPADVMLENIIDVRRDYKMNVSSSVVLGHTAGAAPCPSVTPENIDFYWNYVEGAEEYDFEWVYKSDEDTDPAINFLDATRITTSNEHYSITTAYDNGKIYYRVRPVAKDFSTGLKRLEGQWTQGSDYVQVCNIEKRNWTYDASFAEDGKRREVMTYFDGSTRNRQAVTVSNTENVALVAEDIYDYEGRPAIQTLPAPSKDFKSALNFYQYFNLNTASSSAPYSKKDFDTDASSLCTGLSLTPGMKATAEGAARYYSGNNSLVNFLGPAYSIPDNGQNNLIPDAEQYPFSQVVYTTDGSVRSQSGVGINHASKSGHETQYFNTTASQEKLDRLFGNEVGYAEHYREKVTIDPNGQISVSYENLSGQVIATCLRGGEPSNLQALDIAPNQEPYVSSELINEHFSSEYDIAQESYNTLKNFIVTDYTSPYEFSYIITPQQFHSMCNSANYNCRYLLEITIKDDCNNAISGETVTLGPNPALNVVHSIGAISYMTGNFEMKFSISFPRNGVYRIEKKLSIDPTPMFEYLNEVSTALNDPDHNGCTEQLDDLQTLYGNGVDMTECLSCESNCEFEAGNHSYPYVYDETHTFDTDEQFLNFCKALCRPRIPARNCNGLLAAMKSDMRPGGQYFEATLSAFNDPGGTFTTFGLSSPHNYFYDGLVFMFPNHSSDPDYDFIGKWIAYNGTVGADAIPSYLSPTWHADLIASWDPRWEDFLVQYHPEYCRYERCNSLTGSYDFDANLLNSNYAEATDVAGSTYYLNLSVTPIGSSVPVLDAGAGTVVMAAMSSQVAGCTNCNTQFAASPLNTSGFNGTTSMWDWATIVPQQISATVGTSAYDNERWANFVKLYIGIKGQKILDAHIGCNALLDLSYPPDNLVDAANLVITPVSDHPTLLIHGLTILDPDPLNSLNAFLADIEGDISANPADPDLSPYDNPQVCVYTNAYTDGYVDQFLTCNFPVGGSTITMYATIANVPLNYPLDVTAAPGPGTVQITVPFTVPGGTSGWSSWSSSVKRAYLVYNIKTAINNYTAGYDFVCTEISGGMDLRITAPAELALFGNAVVLSFDHDGVEMQCGDVTMHGATQNCNPTLPFEPNCACVQIQEAKEFFDSKDENGNYYIDHTLYPSFEYYVAVVAANLSQDGVTVSPGDVLYWYNHCNDNNNTSPFELSETGEVIAGGDNAEHPVPSTLECEEPCQQQGIDEANFYAEEEFQEQMDQSLENFISDYKRVCMNAEGLAENFSVSYYEKEYHYTLYYYDQAGNLVRTIPPSGVRRLSPSQLYDIDNKDKVHLARLDNTLAPIYPEHARVGVGSNSPNLLVTKYKYNTLNQLTGQETPDGGLSDFWYNMIGQLRFSQNAKQHAETSVSADGRYSYTMYDGQGRITEVGENDQLAKINVGGVATDVAFYLGVNNSSFPSKFGAQVTKTYYDAAVAGTSYTYPQEYLRKRVAAVSIEDAEDAYDYTYNNATFYNYDVHGNVKTLYNHYPDLKGNDNENKKVDYTYDLISGNVNTVSYQDNQFDRFYHRYEYDANNRITHVYTSNDKIHWQQDARYFYYLHGPLARIEIGEDKVQGLDYAYTIQGWIKSVNSAAVNTLDAGADSYYNATYVAGQAYVHRNISQDAFGYALEYYNGDYKAIKPAYTGYGNASLALNTAALAISPGLYNGNIKAMSTGMLKPNGTPLADEMPAIVKFFKYDQLNRIKEAQSYTTMAADFSTPAAITPYTTPAISDYYEKFSYDPNGNILFAQRNGYTAAGITNDMDDMEYSYYNAQNNNMLNYVNDYGDNPTSTTYTDIKSQAANLNSYGHNYEYDLIGNLVYDKAENITNIDWSVYGKILKIYKPDYNIEFKYDAAGNRIEKIVKPIVSGLEKKQEDWVYTYYMRDAQGNVLAVYNRDIIITSSTVEDYLRLQESHIYGSSRLGMAMQEEERHDMTPGISAHYDGHTADGRIIRSAPAAIVPSDYVPHNTLGFKRYELSNHLGNANVIISDRKFAVDDGSFTPTGIVDRYLPQVISAQDYYSFGAVMPGRSFYSGSYRYGFNGKENDNEVKGIEGSQQDYGMRIYDPRLGKFLSVDPLSSEFPWNSTYAFAENTPIQAVDLDGKEIFDFMDYSLQWIYGKNTIQKIEQETVIGKTFYYYTSAAAKDAVVNMTYGKGIQFSNRVEKDGYYKAIEYEIQNFVSLGSKDFMAGAQELYARMKQGDKTAYVDAVVLLANIYAGIKTGGATGVAKVESFEFENLGYKYKGVVSDYGKNGKMINHFLAKDGNLISLGYSVISDGVLENYFNVPEFFQNKGVSKAMYNEAGSVGYNRVSAQYNAQNFKAFNNVYKANGGNAIDALLQTPAGKVLSGKGFHPTKIKINHSSVEAEWVK